MILKLVPLVTVFLSSKWLDFHLLHVTMATGPHNKNQRLLSKAIKLSHVKNIGDFLLKIK